MLQLESFYSTAALYYILLLPRAAHLLMKGQQNQSKIIGYSPLGKEFSNFAIPTIL